MRNIYILWGLLACMAFTSCYEEDTLTPTEGGVELRFKVPQGNNSWDDDIAQIYEDYLGNVIVPAIISLRYFERNSTPPSVGVSVSSSRK